MAMYYQGGSEIQPDGLHTLYLMNPNYVGYADHPTNMLLLNSVGSTSSHALNSIPVPLAPLPQQVMSIPISHHDPQVQSPAIQRFGYNSWAGSVDQEGGNRNQPNMGQQTPQGLSLSLSTNQTVFNKPINGTTPDQHHHHQHEDSMPKMWSSPSVQSVVMSTSGAANGTSMQSVILGSKYLKAAQQLLDEVANVGKSIKDDDQPSPGSKDKGKVVKESNTGDDTEAASNGIELTTAQRQEIQMKKAKLISMLDEVEQRYRQYNVQMQIIVASFEQAAGIGSAKSYTQLALKTISKQFRCLKDAISTQIKGLSKSLGEEEKIEGSKLKYVDNQLRQHRALQQLGMVQNNAWRPQRGLPERAVSVLRAWLFEHFLHPYPKDLDKQMLAKQTGLTRSQVSNWFINARVRLWKPMVEEMYVEEMKNQQQYEDNTTTTKARPDHQLNNSKIPNKVPSPTRISSSNPTGGVGLTQLITPLNMENLSESSSKKPRNSTDQDDSPNSILSVEMEMKAATNNRGTGYGNAYNDFQELSRFNPGQLAFHGNYNNAQNNVSLTLGLPPSGISAPGTHHQQNFLNFGTTIDAESMDQHDRANNGLHVASHSNIGYDQMLSFQNRKTYPAQLLPDFVA